MRAILIGILVLVVGAGVVFALSGASGPAPPHYTVVFDNAFGLVAGSDMKVAGVRAGKITELRVDEKTHKALVDFEISKEGFGSLRKDVTCESRPQSLIGEYYIDCNPGNDPQQLASGATIPVQQTTSTIPLDLVNNVLRQPYRQRLGIILDELGAGVAGRAPDINDIIRRSSPALRETDKVLEKLAKQNQTLQQLVTNADTVIGDLAANKHNVGRFVVEAHKTAATSAERRADIQAGLERLPTFLRELRPTMADLGAAADANTPALANLNASAGQLTTFLRNLKPLAQSTQVNLRSLAQASRTGRPAVKAARPLVNELDTATVHAPELAKNSAIVLEHLNDRKHAVEKDPRSPHGQGYTGFESILQWPFDQSQAINVYDKNGYMLKVDLFHSKCSDYENPQTLKVRMAVDPSFYKDCAAILGPNQPGITTPDPTATGHQFLAAGTGKASASRKTAAAAQPNRGAANAPNVTNQVNSALDQLKTTLSKAELRKRAIDILKNAIADGRGNLGKLRTRLERQLGVKLPRIADIPKPFGDNQQAPTPSFPTPGGGATPSLPSTPSPSTTGPLLDYLFAP